MLSNIPHVVLPRLEQSFEAMAIELKEGRKEGKKNALRQDPPAGDWRVAAGHHQSTKSTTNRPQARAQHPDSCC